MSPASFRPARYRLTRYTNPVGSRIKYRKYCPHCNREVPAEEIIKGYQVPGGMIPITESDLASIPLTTLKTIELNRFIKEKQVDPIYYQKPYYLLPDKSDQAYWLLYHSFKKSGKVEIARFAVHSREHLALMRPASNVLTLITLHYPEKIKIKMAEKFQSRVNTWQKKRLTRTTA
jgi:DNA end-binding protein Ku